MNVKKVKKPEQRIDVAYLRNLGIQGYGHDNLYPQTMAKIMAASPTGGACLERYKTFIEGNGFRDIAFSEYVVNRKGETIDDIFHLVCDNVGDNDGFALHVNYNIFGELVEIQDMPFMNCRLVEEDANGYVSKIAVHPDWSGTKTRNGKVLKINKETVDFIDIFNPDKKVVLAQIETAGGIEFYKGQILWVSFAGENIYPKPIFDEIVTELSSDEGLANVKYRNVRCNFLPAGMFINRKGQQRFDDDGKEIKDDNSGFSDTLALFQGDTNANKFLEVTLEVDEEKPEFVPLKSNNYDKEYTVTEASVTERIYCKFNQEPWYCIRIGKVGFSGDILEDAFEYYNSFVSKKQRKISRAFKYLFKYWPEVANLTNDFSIEPLIYVRNGTTNNNG